MGSFRPSELGESQKALHGVLGRVSIACGVGVQRGAFELQCLVITSVQLATDARVGLLTSFVRSSAFTLPFMVVGW